MERIEQLNTMYEYARTKGLCSNRKTFAALLNMNEGNMSSAFSGNVRYLTTNLLLRINKVLGDVFSNEWLLTGAEPIYKSDGDSIHHNSAPVATRGAQINTSTTNNNDQLNDQLIAQLKAQITALQSQITTLQAQLDTLQSRIADLKNDKEKLYQLLLKQ